MISIYTVASYPASFKTLTFLPNKCPSYPSCGIKSQTADTVRVSVCKNVMSLPIPHILPHIRRDCSTSQFEQAQVQPTTPNTKRLQRYKHNCTIQYNKQKENAAVSNSKSEGLASQLLSSRYYLAGISVCLFVASEEEFLSSYFAGWVCFNLGYN